MHEGAEPYAVLRRQVTEQDRALYSLCRPERLLEIMFRYMLFDAGEKKVARYQQYFCVCKILDRIREVHKDNTRQGGVVWHTQGSGKSLTMVMLAQGSLWRKVWIILRSSWSPTASTSTTRFTRLLAIAARNRYRPGPTPVGAIGDHKQRIITTVIDKFEAAVGKNAVRNDNPNIFVLVDEGHRGQYRAACQDA